MCVRLLHPMTLTSNVNKYMTDGETESIIRESATNKSNVVI